MISDLISSGHESWSPEEINEHNFVIMAQLIKNYIYMTIHLPSPIATTTHNFVLIFVH